MPINESEIIVGGKYKTPNNQERIVVGLTSENKVVYASRGGNVKNEFDHRNTSSLSRFSEACSEKIGQLTDSKILEALSVCNAQNEIEK